MNKKVRKISTKLTIVVILSGILSILIFLGLYRMSNYVVAFFKDNYTNNQTDKIVESLQNSVTEENLTIEDEWQIQQVVEAKQEKNSYISIMFYDLKSDEIIFGSFSEELPDIYYGSIFDIDSVYSQEPEYAKITFADSQEVGVLVYSFDGIWIAAIYIVIIIVISIIVFIAIILLFMKKKMNYLFQLQEEVSLIETGNLTHPITKKGNDELTALAFQIEQLKFTLAKNMESEKEAMRANVDLITAMSHDLKTPLTTLMGYMDIIRLKKYKDEAQYELYLNNCIDKINQINNLSNKMFEYFLVFGTENNVDLSPISSSFIGDYLFENILFFEETGYVIEHKIIQREVILKANTVMLKRILDNIFSNLLKYADKAAKIEIMMQVEKNELKLAIQNQKKKDSNLVESTQIGLKSLQRMVELHEGKTFIQDKDSTFIIIIQLPLIY